MGKYFRRKKFKRRFRRKRIYKSIRKVVKRTVKSMAETKIRLLEDIGVPCTTNLLSYGWSGIPQGIQSNQRIGNKIQLHRYGFRLSLNFAKGVGGSSSATVRMGLVYPRKGGGDNTLGTIAMARVNQYWDPLVAHVLWDKTVVLGDDATNLRSSYVFRLSKKAWYIWNFTANGDVEREPVLIIFSNLSPVDTSSVTYSIFRRVSFKDI